MQAWQFNLIYTKKRPFGSFLALPLWQKLCNNQKTFDYCLTVEDYYPNDNIQVFPYFIEELFSSGI